jgi:hypothetical protein
MPTTYIKGDLVAFSQQLNNYSGKLSNYTTTLNLTADEIASSVADAAYLAWVVNGMVNAEDNHRQWTAFKDLMRYGPANLTTTAPIGVVLPAPPDTVAPDIQLRFSSQVARIKKHPNYTDAIGKELGIIAAHTPFNPQDGKPVIKVVFSSGGHPHLLWTKGKFQGIEIWKDKGTGFERLDKDFNPDFTDKAALPAEGASAIWKYKVIYLYKDEQVGSWSDEISVTVSGQV